MANNGKLGVEINGISDGSMYSVKSRPFTCSLARAVDNSANFISSKIDKPKF